MAETDRATIRTRMARQLLTISRMELRVVMNRTKSVDEFIVVDTTFIVKFIFYRRYQAVAVLAKLHIMPPVAPLVLPVPVPDEGVEVAASGWARPAADSSETAA